MKEFPGYAERKEVERMYGELGFSEEKRDTLDKYLTAFVRLYGVITVKEAYEIIISQNDGIVSRGEFLAYINAVRLDGWSHSCICTPEEVFEDASSSDDKWEWLITGEHILDLGSVSGTLSDNEGIPRKILDREEMLKYGEAHYFPETPEFFALVRFFEDTGMDEKESYESAEDCVLSLGWFDERIDENPYKSVLSDMHMLGGIELTDEELPRFTEVCGALLNSTRRYCLNGHTAVELYELTGRPIKEYDIPDYNEIKSSMSFQQLAAPFKEFINKDNIMDIFGGKKPEPVSKGAKIGRNDPCPCGSGKKYKKCCGR